MSFWGYLIGREDCPRCDSPLRRTDRIVNRVEYVWVCDVCGGRLPLTDRRLVMAARGSRVTAGVYAIINTVNGRRYIGSTKNFNQRRQRHLSSIRRGFFYPSRQILPDLHEHGFAVFTIELIEGVEPDDAALEAAERRWMQHFDEVAPGSLYNVDRAARRPFWRQRKEQQ